MDNLIPLTEHNYKNSEIPILSVFSWAFNHKDFIRESIESILVQRTNFKVEIIIHDDASSDGTKEIIKEYQDKYPYLFNNILQEENQWSQGKSVMNPLFEKPKGKYIALTHGDDYWTDPFKLQKQVDFLESSPDFSICWTKYKILKKSEKNTVIEEPDWIDNIDVDKNFSIDLNNFSKPYCTYTLTAMFRANVIDFKLFSQLKHVKDNSLYLIVLTKGKGMLLNFYSAVYRMHDGGVYSSASQFNQVYFSYLNIKEIIVKIPNCNNQNLRQIRDSLLIQTLVSSPKKLSKDFFKLLFNSCKFLGTKQTVKIIVKKIFK